MSAKVASAAEVAARVAEELALIHDATVRAALQGYLVPPSECLLTWDYGALHPEFPEPRYPGFIVARFPQSDTGIAYSEYGAIPSMPWILVFLSEPGFGMDANWFETLEEAFRSSMAWPA